LSDLGSRDSVRNIVSSMLTAGVTTTPLVDGKHLNQLAGLENLGSTSQAVFSGDSVVLGDFITGVGGRALVKGGVDALLLDRDFGESVVNSVVADVSAVTAFEIGERWGGGVDPLRQTLAHAALGCASASLSGGECAAGAAGSASESLFGNLLDAVVEGPVIQGKLDQALYLASATLIGGIAGGSTGNGEDGVISGAQTALNAATNNYLSPGQKQQRARELRNCSDLACRIATTLAWEGTDLLQDAAFTSGLALGVVFEGSDLIRALPDLPEAVAAVLENPALLAQMPASYARELKDAYASFNTAFESAGVDGATAVGVEATKLLVLLAAVPTTGVAAVKLPGTVVKVVGGSRAAGGVDRFTWVNADLGRIDGIYSAIEPSPLADGMAGSFAGGRYVAVTLEKDTVLYRAGTANQPLGQFFSQEPPSGILQTRIDKAVLPEWPGGAKSPIDTSFAVRIPTGTQVYLGEISSQGGFYVGGTQQIVVPKPWLIDGVQVIYSSPLK
jgi:filamentous hemagglutinin